MTHAEHVQLIQDGLTQQGGGVWADFGSGEGAFTLALRDVLGQFVEIYSVDQNKVSLERQKELFRERFLGSKVQFINADFTKPLELAKLDGILAANSLHFVEDKIPLLKLWKNYLKPGGRLLVVEYNSDEGNAWVPYPLSYQKFEKTAKEVGFTRISFLSSTPSNFLQEIYAAVAFNA